MPKPTPAPEVATLISNDPEHRHCAGCGKKGGPWRVTGATRCVNCDAKIATQRKEWAKEYHAARARAVSKLIKRHHVEFDRLLDMERFPGPENAKDAAKA